MGSGLWCKGDVAFFALHDESCSAYFHQRTHSVPSHVRALVHSAAPRLHSSRSRVRASTPPGCSLPSSSSTRHVLRPPSSCFLASLLLLVPDGPWRLNPRGRPLPFPGSFPFKRASKPGSNPVAFPFQRVLKGRGVGAGANDVHLRPSRRAHAWIGVAERARTRSRHGGGSASAHVAERAGPDLAEMDLRRRKGAWRTRHGGVDEDPGDGS